MNTCKTVEALMERLEASTQAVLPYSRDRIKVGVDLGTAYLVVTVLNGENEPLACERLFASVVKDGVVVDFGGAQRAVSELRGRLEHRLGFELTHCAIAMPFGTDSSLKTHRYVAEGAGLEVTAVVDEPSAANAVLGIEDGVVVDIGGGTTGIAVFRGGRVAQLYDEPTGGTHMSLVLAGSRGMPFEAAEQLKTDPAQQTDIFPVLVPVMEKMATIVRRHVRFVPDDVIYLVGGTCCFPGIETVFASVTGQRVVKPANPLMITPLGIAMSCEARPGPQCPAGDSPAAVIRKGDL